MRGGKIAKRARARLATLPKAGSFADEEGAEFTLMGDGGVQNEGWVGMENPPKRVFAIIRTLYERQGSFATFRG